MHSRELEETGDGSRIGSQSGKTLFREGPRRGGLQCGFNTL